LANFTSPREFIISIIVVVVIVVIIIIIIIIIYFLNIIKEKNSKTLRHQHKFLTELPLLHAENCPRSSRSKVPLQSGSGSEYMVTPKTYGF